MILARKHKCTTTVILFFAATMAVGCGQKKPQVSATDQQKIAALDQALKSGVLTQQEYSDKLKAITNGTAGANSTQSNGAASASGTDADKLQALDRACSAGALTPDECAAKRAAITGAASNANPAPADAASQAAAPAADPSTSQPSAPPEADTAGASAGGSVYNDPLGKFSVTIPQGWQANQQGPSGANGVQMSQGKTWAIVAPFNKVKEAGEVVNALASQIQSQYQNFAVGQHGTMKLNGLDAAVATFSGINSQGAQVTVVIMGVAAPRQFFAVMSSVPQGQEQFANPALSAMVQSIRFGGQ